MSFRIRDHGSTRSPGHAWTPGPAWAGAGAGAAAGRAGAGAAPAGEGGAAGAVGASRYPSTSLFVTRPTLNTYTASREDLLTAANDLLDTWIGDFDLGRAYLEAGVPTQADSQFDRCLKRKGEALSLFADE